MMLLVNMSPSPRKAWIETVAERAQRAGRPSPSPRKAWIETSLLHAQTVCVTVAFPPEGVD